MRKFKEVLFESVPSMLIYQSFTGTGGTNVSVLNFQNQLTEKEFKHAMLLSIIAFPELNYIANIMNKQKCNYTKAVKEFHK